MRLRKQRKIDYNNLQENKSRIAHEYKIGDKAYLLKNVLVSKNALDREGPYDVIDINTNGAVAIRRGAIIQTVNIRHLLPHF